MARRVLILSWEYPPVIEGGLARHVRKLAEELVAPGRRRRRAHARRGASPRRREHAARASRVHRVREPRYPRDLDRFLGLGCSR